MGFFPELLVFELIPNLVTFFLSIVCACVLLAWLCWLRTRRLLKAQMRRVIKEVGVWLVFLVVYCVLVIFLFNKIVVLKYVPPILNPILHSFIPIIFFIYLCVSLRKTQKKTVIRYQAMEDEAFIQTAGLRTAPPSTRVSLPSNTSAHTPNFLSPSEEFTNTSPLLT